MKLPRQPTSRPVLFVDVDGVISVFGFADGAPPPGRFHNVDGTVHCIREACGGHFRRLAAHFELVWATGWEERANEHLPWILGLEGEWPTLSFDERPVWGTAHWKLAPIDRYARGRPAAWIDDSLSDECYEWAERRSEPTLLVHTDPAVGITPEQVDLLEGWARDLAAQRARGT